jgi:hypothetical protein
VPGAVGELRAGPRDGVVRCDAATGERRCRTACLPLQARTFARERAIRLAEVRAAPDVVGSRAGVIA